MSQSRFFTVLPLAFALAAQVAVSAPILYYTPALTTNGLGQPASNTFTTAIEAQFGAANVIEIPDFEDPASYSGGSALFVNARNSGAQPQNALSALERANLANFINSGGAVFFVGDHGSWETWDNSFLSLFGDAFETWTSVGVAIGAPARPSELAGSVLLTAPGAIAGGNGTPIYTSGNAGTGQAMAALYGPNDNAIAFLDTNAFGMYQNGGIYSSFYTDLASWLFNTASAYEQSLVPGSGNNNPPSRVPDSGVSVAFAATLMTLAFAGRRHRRA